MPEVVKKKSFETLDDVRRYIRNSINDGREYIMDTVKHYDDEFEQVADAEEKDLPKHVNVKSLAAQELLKARLQKEEPDYEPLLNVLSDTEFNYESYKYLGENDGLLHVMADMAHMLGMEEESKKAYEAIYSMD